MIEILQLLTRVQNPINDDEVGYLDADIHRHATEVHRLGVQGNDMLAVRVDGDGFKVSFVLFTHLATFSVEDGGHTLWKRVMHGYGYAENLRELRHTFWGEADNGGYIFYPSLEAIAQAMNVLKKWFD